MEVRSLKAEQMLVLTNMISKILSEVDDLKAMLKELQYNNFRENYEGEEE
tara:strand:- start:31 stop:180 length:150 start_codon:yes stop_codon:yes gene_type:complete